MLKKVEGIVIRTVDYGETNKIITLYTRETGKVGVMARGAKKPKSRLSAVSQLFVYGHYLYQHTSGLGDLNQGEAIDSFRSIRNDLFLTSYAAYAVELVDKLTEDKKPNPYLFETLYQVMHALDEEKDPEVVLFIFELKMLSVAGINPQLRCCVNCGLDTGKFEFSIREGGFLCHRCLSIDPYHIPLKKRTAELLHLFAHMDLARLGNISLKSETKKEIRDVLNQYFDAYSGLYLKSKRFLEQLDRFKLD
ncbi:DNA repair protein RecO [Guptibacillus algicola]|uniref:DNA repair protein RecO n=1 Tax=Guptibacillus algicola TaxID=225844 RepID=UPI001CD4ED16|nr:DNA repair protein RecO [Alkalihalobacillus algicola]MCA0986080.1 DNA repair protein RecO [Alkalihalobacillus algicola]